VYSYKENIVKLSLATVVFLALGLVVSTTQVGHAAQEPMHQHQAITLAELLNQAEEEAAPVVVCSSDPKEGNDRCVPKYRFSDEVSEKSSKRIIAWIEASNKAGADELLLEINTPGGSVSDGFEVMRAIEESNAPVTCVVDGDADSMGFAILQSCEKRVMTRRSKLMAHEPAIGGSIHGQPNTFIAIAEMMKADRDALAIHCAHRLKVTLAEYHRRTDGGLMWWMLSEEAKKVGAVDSVSDSVKAIHKEMLHKHVPKKR
jgi:ATP-dependent Clp protease protease subunit